MRTSLIAVLLLACAVMMSARDSASQARADAYPFRNPSLPDEERITDLISRLTLAEKVECMGARAAVPRLGVAGSPHIEGYHGVAQGGPSNWGQRNPVPTTQFPQAYGLGATWDPELLRRVAAQEALEARYLFQSAVYNRSGIIIRAPNADLARDPRWGRTEEVYGRFIGSPVERPMKRLVGFSRVTIPAGQTRRVEVPVRGADLAYWDAGRHAWALERARLELMVGGSSADAALTLKTAITITP